MMDRPCDRVWEIDPYREGRLAAKAAKSFERHLRACADCRRQMEQDAELRELARQLPNVAPGDLTLRRLKARTLRDAAIGAPTRAAPGRRFGVAAIAVTVGLAASLFVASRRTPQPRTVVATNTPANTTPSAPEAPIGEALAGSAVASAGAHWSQMRDRGIERIELDDGALRVHVRAQVSGERFLVEMPDGEIEVRGTTFDVSVEHGTTMRVHVDEGVVELRIRGRGATRLSADETYVAPAPPSTLASGEAIRTLRGPVTPPPATVPPTAKHVEDHDVAYATAIALLREGHDEQAASAFHALALTAVGTPKAEDASFLEAVALARAGRTDAAALAAEHHLASFPDSFHRKEAAILVIRAASQRGDCAKARAVMASWKGDSLEPNLRNALGLCEGGTP